MYKITNVTTLGNDYIVKDNNEKVIKTIQVIPEDEILKATLGKYTPDCGSYTEYLTKSISALTGFDTVDPDRVLWYATEDKEVVLLEIIEYAIKHGYDKIILEHLETIE